MRQTRTNPKFRSTTLMPVSPARRILGDGAGSGVYRNPYATFDARSGQLLLNFVNTTNCSRTDPCFGRWTSLQMHSDTDGVGAWSSPTSVRWQSPTAGQQLRGDGSLMGPGHGVQLQHCSLEFFGPGLLQNHWQKMFTGKWRSSPMP